MASQLGVVSEMYRYPVKSMQGERLAEAQAAADGFPGDRAWAIKDEQRGSIEGARKIPGLLNCRSRHLEAEVDAAAVPQVELPDGQKLAANDPALAEQLSALVERPVSLWPRRPASDLAHYQRGPMEADDMMEELRTIFARLPDEPLPDLAAFPPEVLTSATLPGTYFDASPFFILSRRSLDSMAAAQPKSSFDARRFRPNILLETAENDHPYPENEWVGSNIQIGDAVFRVDMECPRCAMTTLAFDDLPKDPGIMRALVRENGGNLGVYASVVQPGRLREGDAVIRVD